MTPRRTTRLTLALALGSTLGVAACGGGTLGTSSSEEATGPVKIGLLVPQSGVYKSLGDDMKAGFEVYLKEKGNKLGGKEVQVVTADEGETADTGKAAADKLVKQDKATVVTGVVSSATMNGIVDLFETSQIPLVGSNASPTTLTGKKFVWRTSYVNDEPGKALGAYVAKQEKGPVYLLAADYQAGKDETGGFKETFEPAGGKVAAEVYTPFPGTKNFQPFLANLQKSGAKSVFTFYAGGAAVDFVKQYDQFGLAGKVTHYSAGFLTEGGVLTAQGKAALGTKTAMNYSADLDNEVNKKFVEAYVAATGKQPTTYAMASYDAARVIDMAIEKAGKTDSKSINNAIGQLGDIESPRGTWSFNDNGTPKQMWYLREVKEQDGKLANVVIEELGELG
ncbi:ABC transporter substrate-binding protein [Knoellia sp. 3-2P3]|uniref:ABC transporter substrate-binding protein n=1 Tax=unclassified Knoellia TaxID=2618719 RepID=UPI0023DBAC1B|nr:ABC transporter substrate-binding protein [Knoellia sp. 3-2P3]MDF2091584.1 ABC transporter substrate-binding protein [Knoellia sp. 3-2P3]